MWDVEFVLAYVPETEYLTWDEAVQLAKERDMQAALQLAEDYEVYDGNEA